MVERPGETVSHLSNQLAANLSTACRIVRSWELDDVSASLAKENFDAVLLNLPAADREGLQACSSMSEAAPHVPVLVVTETRDDSLDMTAMDAGAEDCIVGSECDGPSLMLRIQLAMERIAYTLRTQPGVAEGPAEASDAEAAPRLDHAADGQSASRASSTAREPAYGDLDQENAPAAEQVSLLCLGADPAYARLLGESLIREFAAKVEYVAEVNLAEEELQGRAYTAILVDLGAAGPDGAAILERLRRRAGAAPILALADGDDATAAVRAVRNGAHDCFDKSHLSIKALAGAIRRAVKRSRRGAGMPRRFESLFAPPAQRREHVRYQLSRPLLAIPVFPSGAPDWARRAQGQTVDLSDHGLGFQVREALACHQTMVIGVEDEQGDLHFAAVEILAVQPNAEGYRVSARFADEAGDPLGRANLTPQFNPHSYQFETGLPEESLRAWTALGVIRPVLLDYVHVCPECQSLPTFRKGCCSCGSSRTASQQLIHHFACAHVGHVAEFERDGELACPKCRTRRMVVGADFELLNGPYRCLDCGWSDVELAPIAQCLRCGLRLPADQCHDLELIGYDLQRLDPLALVAGA